MALAPAVRASVEAPPIKATAALLRLRASNEAGSQFAPFVFLFLSWGNCDPAHLAH